MATVISLDEDDDERSDAAVVVHLDHPRAYRNAETVRRNREIWTETEQTGRVQGVVGLGRLD